MWNSTAKQTAGVACCWKHVRTFWKVGWRDLLQCPALHRQHCNASVCLLLFPFPCAGSGCNDSSAVWLLSKARKIAVGQHWLKPVCFFPGRSLRNWLEIEGNNLRNANSGKMMLPSLFCDFSDCPQRQSQLALGKLEVSPATEMFTGSENVGKADHSVTSLSYN